MKTLFIEARKKIKITPEIIKTINKIAELLPHKIGLLSTVQYSHLLKQIKKELEKKGKIISIAKSKNLSYPGQILGCNLDAANSVKADVEAFLFVGSGRFHALQAALATNKEIFIWQIESKKSNNIDRIKKEEIEKLQKKKKAALINFLSADTIGILVSIKPGQEQLKRALVLKKKIEKSDKKAFIFIADIIKVEELENFSCKAWVNTACPNIVFDSTKIVNPADLYQNRKI